MRLEDRGLEGWKRGVGVQDWVGQGLPVSDPRVLDIWL